MEYLKPNERNYGVYVKKNSFFGMVSYEKTMEDAKKTITKLYSRYPAYVKELQSGEIVYKHKM